MRKKNEAGIALIAVLMMLLLLGALFETFVISLNSEQRSLRATLSETDTGGRTEYTMRSIARSIADEINAGRLTGDGRISNEMRDDLIKRATARFDSENLGLTIRANITPRSGYGIGKQNTLGASAGTFAGMSAMIIPYIITVTGSTAYGEEIKLEQEVQIVYIPAFQFGMFSESDLAFFAGNNFDFGGRVHTNGDLYLLGNTGGTPAPIQTMRDHTSAAGKIWRKTKPNRIPLVTGNNGTPGTVKIAHITNTAPTKELGSDSGNDGPNYKNDDARWKRDMFDPGASTTFNGFLSNGYTGTKSLHLPLVTSEASPIDIIRRPPEHENVNAPELFEQRYFSIASVRILLSDEVRDFNLPTVTSKPPVALDGAYLKEGATMYQFAKDKTAADASGDYYTPGGAPLIGGYIKVEMQKNNSQWVDVTDEILGLGVSGVDMTGKCAATLPVVKDAVIRLQRFSDRTSNTCTPTDGTQFWPNVLFDTREASTDSTAAPANNRVHAGGIMHYVELDVKNLSRWLKSSDARVYDTGYVVYFSDRRSSPRVSDGTGESKDTPMYGFENSEQCISSTDSRYGCPNGRADTNGNKVADGVLNPLSVAQESPKSVRSVEAGNGTLYAIKSGLSTSTIAVVNNGTAAITSTTAITPMTAQVDKEVAKKIRPLFFRRALKLTNGEKIELGDNDETAIPYGLAIASENPMYIEGNYNAKNVDDVTNTTSSKYRSGGNSVPASVIADAVTVLSNSWKDKNSFDSPYACSGRGATTTYYRMAIIAGKNKNFVNTLTNDFGTDGGAHNFLRYLENWKTTSTKIYYNGSIVSLYYSQEAMSTFKANANVYDVPPRDYSFDTEFLNFQKLPPRTPMFRDINILGFARVTKSSGWNGGADGGGTTVVITKP